jgi:hypothetical protein
MAAWRDGVPAAEDALRLAAGTASDLGLRVVRDGDAALLIGPDFALHVRPGRKDRVVVVPWAWDEPGAAQVGVALREALDASMLLVDTPRLLDPGPYDPHRPSHQVLIALLVDLDAPQVVTVRELDHGADPGADFTLGAGRPDWARTVHDPWLAEVEAILARHGSTAVLEGAHQQLPVSDATDPTRDVTNGAGGRHVTVEVRGSAARSVPAPPGGVPR